MIAARVRRLCCVHRTIRCMCWIPLLLQCYYSEAQVCEENHYFDSSAGRCCNQCDEGEGIKTRCSNTTDNQCIECPEQTYSALSSFGRICKACTVCKPSRTTVSLCTSTQDTVCGSCSVGWFLYVSSSGPNQCLKCSPCPPGEAVIHWKDCAIAGLSTENQCKPGLYTASELPTNRSGFIVQNNNEVLYNAPSDSLPVIIITTVALVAGAFAVFFFLVVFVMVSRRICKQERQNYLRLNQLIEQD